MRIICEYLFKRSFSFFFRSQLQVVDAEIGVVKNFLSPLWRWISGKPVAETNRSSVQPFSSSSDRLTVEERLKKAVKSTDSNHAAQIIVQTKSKGVNQEIAASVAVIKNERSETSQQQSDALVKSTALSSESLAPSIEKPTNKFGIRKGLVQEKINVFKELTNGKLAPAVKKALNVHFADDAIEYETVKWDGWSEDLEKSSFDETMPSVTSRAAEIDRRIHGMAEIQQKQMHRSSSTSKNKTPEILTPPPLPPRPSAQQNSKPKGDGWSSDLERSTFDKTMPSVRARVEVLKRRMKAAESVQPIKPQPTPRRAKYGGSKTPTPPPLPPRPSHLQKDPFERNFDEKRETVHRMLAGKLSGV